MLGHTALKTPIFRSLYSSWEQTHRFKPSFSSSLGLTSIFNAFSSPAIFAFQHYLIIIDISVYLHVNWYCLITAPPSPMYRVSKNVLYPKMQNFKNFYCNKDNRIWCFWLILVIGPYCWLSVEFWIKEIDRISYCKYMTLCKECHFLHLNCSGKGRFLWAIQPNSWHVLFVYLLLCFVPPLS